MKIANILKSMLSIAVMTVFIAMPAVATTNANGTVQSYSSDRPLDIGTIVELTGSGTSKVKPATQKQLERMYGVVVDPKILTVTISSGDQTNATFVATTGTYKGLVSTQNGPIAIGDYLTMSSVDGILMKAGTSTEQSTVFGLAQAPFDGKGITLGTTTLKDTTGAVSKTVSLGTVPVSIEIKHNPNEKSTKVNVPDFLQRVGLAVAEKEVSPARIYLSIAITVISLIAAIAVIYAGVRNSVISIGRNPMSKKSIFRALLEIILTSFLIVIIGLFAVYLLLKL